MKMTAIMMRGAPFLDSYFQSSSFFPWVRTRPNSGPNSVTGMDSGDQRESSFAVRINRRKKTKTGALA
jgi:hypothetical protein